MGRSRRRRAPRVLEPVQRLDRFTWGGTAAYLAGVTVAGLALPHDVAGEVGQETRGSPVWAVVGLAVLSVGAGCALVGRIGWGVKYGREVSAAD